MTKLIPQIRKKQALRLLFITAIVSTVAIYQILQIDSVIVNKAKFTKHVNTRINEFMDQHFINSDLPVNISELNKDKADEKFFEEMVGKSQNITKADDKRGQEDASTERQKNTENSNVRAAMVLVITQRLDIELSMHTMKSYQERFNDKYKYDWIVISYRSLSSELRELFTAVVGGGSKVKFIDLRYQSELLGYRPDTDKIKTRQLRLNMNLPRAQRKQNSIQSRHFTRFLAGHFYNLDSIWNDYDYYWKIPFNSRLEGDVNYDVFKYMQAEDIKYGWLLMSQDPPQMFPNLLNHVKDYVQDSSNNFLPESDKTTNSFQFILHNDTVNDMLNGNTDPFWKYGACSYNSDFELVNIEFFRSKQYRHFFNYLDNINGIYYETWRESHIKTIATSLFLDSKHIKYFDDIAVLLPGSNNCPVNVDSYLDLKCTCNPAKHGEEYTIIRKFKGVFEVMSQTQCVNTWLKKLNKPIPDTFKSNEESLSFFEIFKPSKEGKAVDKSLRKASSHG